MSLILSQSEKALVRALSRSNMPMDLLQEQLGRALTKRERGLYALAKESSDDSKQSRKRQAQMSSLRTIKGKRVHTVREHRHARSKLQEREPRHLPLMKSEAPDHLAWRKPY